MMLLVVSESKFHRMPTADIAFADLIIVEKEDGRFFVEKDRIGGHGLIDVKEVIIRIGQHLAIESF